MLQETYRVSCHGDDGRILYISSELTSLYKAKKFCINVIKNGLSDNTEIKIWKTGISEPIKIYRNLNLINDLTSL